MKIEEAMEKLFEVLNKSEEIKGLRIKFEATSDDSTITSATIELDSCTTKKIQNIPLTVPGIVTEPHLKPPYIPMCDDNPAPPIDCGGTAYPSWKYNPTVTTVTTETYGGSNKVAAPAPNTNIKAIGANTNDCVVVASKGGEVSCI